MTDLTAAIDDAAGDERARRRAFQAHPCACIAVVIRELDGEMWRCECATCGARWAVKASTPGVEGA